MCYGHHLLVDTWMAFSMKYRSHIQMLFICTLVHIYWTLFLLRNLTVLKIAACFFFMKWNCYLHIMFVKENLGLNWMFEQENTFVSCLQIVFQFSFGEHNWGVQNLDSGVCWKLWGVGGVKCKWQNGSDWIQEVWVFLLNFLSSVFVCSGILFHILQTEGMGVVICATKMKIITVTYKMNVL
jgi:hypothetical protein